eukprot:CAMPEP_0202861240 /NCGR_PEP_ID=MMETSP1391-20130828/2705_1 /ASSEMBLY_ACC=CAM_ASM_000867 /TAXON_ID=1034604 /ORGANISM="Chlamydomonas leiostraca, Strain SAG 11-49" /LENGTH=553 /DNA_ID=CAMNT_0049540595 /DNA_START=188 /DNA_END=1849 /DNA_ORIENTATION=-
MSVRLAQLRAARSGLGAAPSAGGGGGDPSPCDLPGHPTTTTATTTLTPPSHASALVAELRARGRVVAPATREELEQWAGRSGDAAAVLGSALRAGETDASASTSQHPVVQQPLLVPIAPLCLPFPHLADHEAPMSVSASASQAEVVVYLQHAANDVFRSLMWHKHGVMTATAAEAAGAAEARRHRLLAVVWAVCHITRVHHVLTWPAYALPGCGEGHSAVRDALIALRGEAVDTVLPALPITFRGWDDVRTLLVHCSCANELFRTTGLLADMRVCLVVPASKSPPDFDAALPTCTLHLFATSFSSAGKEVFSGAVPIMACGKAATTRLAEALRANTAALVAVDAGSSAHLAALLRLAHALARKVTNVHGAGEVVLVPVLENEDAVAGVTEAIMTHRMPEAPTPTCTMVVAFRVLTRHPNHKHLATACSKLRQQPLHWAPGKPGDQGPVLTDAPSRDQAALRASAVTLVLKQAVDMYGGMGETLSPIVTFAPVCTMLCALAAMNAAQPSPGFMECPLKYIADCLHWAGLSDEEWLSLEVDVDGLQGTRRMFSRA